MFSNSRPIPVYTYLNLLSAIRCKDAGSVKRHLDICPNYLDIAGPNNDTVLHVAVRDSTIDIVTLITNAIKKSGKNLSAYTARQNINGWSALHTACLGASEDIIMHIIECLNENDCRELAQQSPNDCAEIPAAMLFSINPYNLSNIVKEKILAISSTECDVHLSELLNPDDVIAQFAPSQQTTPLIQAACDAVNYVRRTLLISDTHFDSNKFSNEKKHAHHTFTHKMREAITIPFDNPLTEEMSWSVLAHQVKSCEKFSTGNCMEFAHLTAYQLIKNGILNVEVVYISNGDHVFVAVNRDPKSNIENYATWGEKAFVIDAWAGSIFPASQIPQKLTCYYRVVMNTLKPSTTGHNLRGKFNPKVHSMQLGLAFSNTFIQAISDLYQSFPYIENLLKRNQLQEAIAITCHCLLNTASKIDNGKFFVSKNPQQERMIRIATLLELLCKKIGDKSVDTLQGFTTLLCQFIFYSKNKPDNHHRPIHIALEKTINQLNSHFSAHSPRNN